MSRVIIVTGLPRSGTSLLMQMLHAAGVEILCDEQREPDGDNPRGYFEYTPVKRLDRDSAWVEAAQGKALKVVAPLLPHLPVALRYDVIFIDRALEEVLASQQVMMKNRGFDAPTPEQDAALRTLFEKSLAAAKMWLAACPDVRCLNLSHAQLLANSQQEAAKIAAFLGVETQAEALARVVDSTLYRQRA